MALGLGFQPGTQDQDRNIRDAEQPGARRQEAIRMLSLRLPGRYGATAITPRQLAGAPGGMGAPGARPGATAQALAMMAGVPFGPVSAPTIPSAQQDRASGISRALPQPAPRESGSAIFQGGQASLAGGFSPQLPHFTYGQETGEGSLQGGGVDSMIRGYVNQPQPSQPMSDPYEELRFILGLGQNNYNLR